MSAFLETMTERVSRMAGALLARRARPLRFAIVGGTTGVVQLGVLAVLVSMGLQPLLANALAFALSAQMSFVLSQAFTWRDRHGAEPGRSGLLARWAAFHACISGGAVVNLAVFALALHAMPHLFAAVLGILAGASLNFLTNDHLTFRRAPRANRGASAGAGDLAALRVSPMFEEQRVR